MRQIRQWMVLAVAIAALSGCGPKKNEVKIALAIPLTGDIASLGQGIKRSIVLAIDEANAAKRFPFEIKLVSFDDRSDPKEAVSVANRIVADRGVVGVIGHFNSGCSIPASGVYAQAGLPMITPASSNPLLTEQQLEPQWSWPKNIFRMNTTDKVQGSFGADFVVKTSKLTRVAVVHDKTSYGQGVAEEFRKQAVKNGGMVVAFEGLQTGERDFRSLLTRIKSHNPQALYWGGMFSEGGLVVRQARDIGFNGMFVGPEANYDQAFIDVAGPAAEGSYVTFLGSPPELIPAADEFIKKYTGRYPNESIKSYDAYGYEVASLLLEAIEKVGPDRAKIIDYLRGVTFKGILGETRFDEKGDTLNKTVTLFIVKDGKFIPAVRPKGA